MTTKLTDTEILDWLEKHCVYLEHGERIDETAYWPHREVDCNPVEEFVGLSIREYVANRVSHD
jgi:hypothetical protein